MPRLAALAARGEVGLAAVIPDGLPPGSDVGNLAILGYDPAEYHTGRAPIEAAAMGVDLAPDEVAYRCNLVTVDDAGTMVDFAAGHLDRRAEPPDRRRARRGARQRARRRALPSRRRVPAPLRRAERLGRRRVRTAARPHRSARSAPDRAGRARLVDLMEASKPVVHEAAAASDRSRHRSGCGDRALDRDCRRSRSATGSTGRLSSAVDLVRGLGVLTGIEVLDVPGATAGFDNDYVAQREAALESLTDRDFFLLHVEATDEAGHQGAVDEKVRSLERWDADIIGPLVDALDGEHYRVLLMPDHATPCAARTHTSEPVPYLLFDSQRPGPGGTYTERAVAGCAPVAAHDLMARLVG